MSLKFPQRMIDVLEIMERAEKPISPDTESMRRTAHETWVQKLSLRSCHDRRVWYSITNEGRNWLKRARAALQQELKDND